MCSAPGLPFRKSRLSRLDRTELPRAHCFRNRSAATSSGENERRRRRQKRFCGAAAGRVSCAPRHVARAARRGTFTCFLRSPRMNMYEENGRATYPANSAPRLARSPVPSRSPRLARTPTAAAAVRYGINYKRFGCFSTVLIQFHGPVTQYCPCTHLSAGVRIDVVCTRKLRRAQAVASRKPEPNVTVIRARERERKVINSKKNNNNNRNARAELLTKFERRIDPHSPDWSARRRRRFAE